MIETIPITPIEVNGEMVKDPNDLERHGIGLENKQRLTISIEEVLRQAEEPIPWVIEHTLIADTLTLIYGPPKQYKTFLALDMCLSQATGLPFLGQYKILKKGLVVYVAGEGISGVGHRIRAWCIDREMNPKEVCSSTTPFRRTTGPVLIGDGGAQALADEIEECAAEAGVPVAGIYIDTLARNFGTGDENSTKDMNVFVTQCDHHLRQRFKAPVVIVHHTGHDKSDRARGSSVLQAAVDAQFKVTADFPDVFYEPNFMKDAEAPPPHVLEAKLVPLGFNDQFGNPVKSIVLGMTDKKLEKGPRLTGDAKLALELLGQEPRPFQIWRDDFIYEAAKTPVAKGRNKGQKRDNRSLRQAWRRATEKLEKEGRISVLRDNNGEAVSACITRV
ncbi:AAA family ATPase [Seongchinamella unica]|uniref:AAA family ATPase n=1 Tax=Seongchinamella unica TaxID=2547392 RepID=A0A4R5LSR8_9GAMM|nr:helicase RepA family protein [Seongchinamella unica]TDG13969.1 AAA family ATPase [Seongchinamella unica]